MHFTDLILECQSGPSGLRQAVLEKGEDGTAELGAPPAPGGRHHGPAVQLPGGGGGAVPVGVRDGETRQHQAGGQTGGQVV